jgi:hypothetical protein
MEVLMCGGGRVVVAGLLPRIIGGFGRGRVKRVGADGEQQPGLRIQRQSTRCCAGGDGSDNLKRAPVENRHLIGRPIAYVAELAARIESDGMSFVKSNDLPGKRARFNIHHLDLRAVRDEEPLG